MAKKAAGRRTFLRRYTDLPSLIYLLSEKKLTLLDPKAWDDQNDAYYLSLYKKRKHLATLLALCFTEGSETYHHWRVFADGASGVCVHFPKDTLMDTLESTSGLTFRRVTYLTRGEAHDHALHVADLPFRKRYAFRDEKEFRLIYESETQELLSRDIDVPLSCIDHITLSPWMHAPLIPHVKRILKSIEECGRPKVYKSTLISNRDWRTIGEEAL